MSGRHCFDCVCKLLNMQVICCYHFAEGPSTSQFVLDLQLFSLPHCKPLTPVLLCGPYTTLLLQPLWCALFPFHCKPNTVHHSPSTLAPHPTEHHFSSTQIVQVLASLLSIIPFHPSPPYCILVMTLSLFCSSHQFLYNTSLPISWVSFHKN